MIIEFTATPNGNHQADACPVAEGIRAALGLKRDEVAACSSSIAIKDYQTVYDVPSGLAVWIKAYDMGFITEPASFRLQVFPRDTPHPLTVHPTFTIRASAER